MRPKAPELRIGPEPGQQITRHRRDRVVPSKALVKGSSSPRSLCVSSSSSWGPNT
jgi:hypothetical protein